MLSIERLKEIDPELTKGMTDEEITEIRDSLDELADIIFDSWMDDRRVKYYHMKPMKFRPALAKLILEGKKTTTWRLFDDKDLQVGDVLELKDWETKLPFGRAVITEVKEKALMDLDDADWEGHERFASDEEMYQKYREYYPDKKISPHTIVKIIHFQPIEEWDKDFPKAIRHIGFDFPWKNEKVWVLDVPVEEMDIKELTWHFDVPFHWHDGGKYNLKSWDIINHFKKYKDEYERTMNCDLNYPIDIMQNKGKWVILDGLHRLMKAYILKMDRVKVRKIPRSKIADILE